VPVSDLSESLPRTLFRMGSPNTGTWPPGPLDPAKDPGSADQLFQARGSEALGSRDNEIQMAPIRPDKVIDWGDFI
jgi:hypothetical protein